MASVSAGHDVRAAAATGERYVASCLCNTQIASRNTSSALIMTVSVEIYPGQRSPECGQVASASHVQFRPPGGYLCV